MERRAIPMGELYPLLAEQMDRGGSCLLPVTGFSMLPALRQGRDTAVLRRPGRPRRGDVVLYRRENGQFLLHRVVRTGKGSLLCCGDNQWRGETVAPEQVLAVLSAVRRGGRVIGIRSPGWRIWGGLWTALYPVRRPLIALRRSLGRVRKLWKRTRR